MNSGTSIDVYGIWYPPNRDATKTSVRATLDGALQPLEPIIGRQNERYQNLLLFTASDLLPTDHTFTLTADGAAQVLILDYIVYSPSFTRIRDMPDLSMGYIGCSKATLDEGSSIPMGTIVGVVLGMFAFAVLTIIGVWRWKRKRPRRVSTPSMSSVTLALTPHGIQRYSWFILHRLRKRYTCHCRRENPRTMARN